MFEEDVTPHRPLEQVSQPQVEVEGVPEDVPRERHVPQHPVRIEPRLKRVPQEPLGDLRQHSVQVVGVRGPVRALPPPRLPELPQHSV